MKAALLALLMAGCATVPDGSVTFSPDELMTMAAKFAQLEAEVRRLKLEKVPLCEGSGWLTAEKMDASQK